MSGHGGGDGDGTPFIHSGGYIAWRRLGVVLLGVVILPIFQGLANIISAAWDVLAIGPAERVADWITGAVSNTVGSFSRAMSLAWMNVDPEMFGVLAFVAAVVFALAAAYVWAEVVGQ